ncbi:MAG: NAD-dependent malic enzyme [Pseudomonadota bacterium]
MSDPVSRSRISENTLRPSHTGVGLLHDPLLNKGTAFTEEERRNLGLEGLLPHRIATIQEQTTRVMENFRNKSNDMEKYIFMISLQDRNETLFYRVVLDYIDEMMPIIYTPTVGRACQMYGHILRRMRGIFISKYHRGRIREVLKNWSYPNVRVIVVTDGERILGLGDQGASGMGIPVGKLSLYTACAGVRPEFTLPVTLDVGTNNEAFLEDPLYPGIPERRISGAEYDSLIEEFIEAAQEVFPRVLVQFEDFASHNAFRLLAKYRDRICTFNDDIQGTASVVLAGLYSALRVTKKKLTDQKVLFFGAGEAGIGTGDLLTSAMMSEGVKREDAMKHCWFMDSKGLVESTRTDLAPHKRPYAHNHEPIAGLRTAIQVLKPTMLVGASGHARQFTKEIVEEMAKLNERPVIFSLSNPTSKSECTAEEAFTWTKGKVLFASGSPFDPVIVDGKRYVPGQGNNAYIFPGVGLGAVVCGAKRVTDEMFFEAAKTLAKTVTEEDLATGCLFPPLTKIRDVSAHIAAAVVEVAHKRDLATLPRPKDVLAHVKAEQYQPVYKKYV